MLTVIQPDGKLARELTTEACHVTFLCMPLKAPAWLRQRARYLYASGLSTRQVSNQLPCTYSAVHKWCKDIARDRSEAGQLRRPPYSKSWRACRNQARKLMERHLGTHLDSNMVVHHRNGDYADNRLENLVLMRRGEHVAMHITINDPNHLPAWAKRRGALGYWKWYKNWYKARGRSLARKRWLEAHARNGTIL